MAESKYPRVVNLGAKFYGAPNSDQSLWSGPWRNHGAAKAALDGDYDKAWRLDAQGAANVR